MTICLTQKTVPVGLEVRSKVLDRRVQIGAYDISMEDACAVFLYVLTNTSLAEDDPRRKLFEKLKEAEIIQDGTCERIRC